MAHQSLYRTYRPTTFEDVVGQEQVTGPLEKAVKAKTIGHAYLFSGSRGLGKTSLARIFAREIGASERDLYEIDAASNNSVEDIRAITEGVYTLPFDSPYKVYLLDEAHMLSKNAWNAFLKTLEEPPPHAVFILITTEPEKIPETVRSRCQAFEFKKPDRNDLAALVAHVAKKEGAALSPDAADLVAMLADGSYRDALSILQKCLTPLEQSGRASKSALSREDVERLTGAPTREEVHALLAALAAGDRGKALAAVEAAAKSGADLTLFLELLLESLRFVLLIRHAPDVREELSRELGTDEFSALEALAGKSNPGITHDTLRAFLGAAERIRHAPIPALPLELAVFELFPEARG